MNLEQAKGEARQLIREGLLDQDRARDALRAYRDAARAREEVAEQGFRAFAEEQGYMQTEPATPPEVPGYELEHPIGRGSMGTVYRGHQLSMDRTVAVKFLPSHLASNEAFARRFVQEARTVARLNHLNIVTGIDVGEYRGNYYFIMEYVDGDTLGDVLRRGEQVPERRAVEIVGQIAGALEHARENGLVHRDVKPDNILMTSEGIPKLGDLGLALQRGADEEQGRIAGTPHYIAPEVVRREVVDTRADIYSLGVTLFHMVTGRTPFEGTPREVLEQHVSRGVPDPRELDAGVSPRCALLVAGMTGLDPEHRYQTPAEVAEAARVYLEQPGKALPRPAGLPAPVTQRTLPHRQPRSPTGALVTVALVLVLGGGVWMLIPREKGPPLDPPVGPPRPPIEVPEQPDQPVPPTSLRERLEAEAATVLDGVREYQQGSPDDLEGITRRLRAVMERFPGTGASTEAQQLLDDLLAARNEEAQGIWSSLQEAARNLRAEGKLGEALARLGTFPTRLRDTPAGGQMQDLRRELEGEIERRLDAGLLRVEELAGSREFDAALQVLADLQPLADPTRQHRLSSAREEVERLRADREAELAAERVRQLEELRTALAATMGRVRELLARLDLAGAAAAWEELARQPGAEVIAEPVAAGRQQVARMLERHERFRQSLEDLARERIEYASLRGRLLLREEGLLAEVGGKEYPLHLVLLTPETLLELASGGLEKEDRQGYLAAALYLRHAGCARAAVRCLAEGVPGELSPTEGALLGGAAQALLGEAREQEAEALWSLAQALATDGRWKPASEVLRTLLSDPTATATFTTNHRLEIEDALAVAENDGKAPPLIQLILKGKVKLLKTPPGSPLAVEVTYDFEDPLQLADFELAPLGLPGMDRDGGGGGGGPPRGGQPPAAEPEWVIEDGVLRGSGTRQLLWRPAVVGDLIVQYEFTTSGDRNIGMTMFRNATGDCYLACLGFDLVGDRIRSALGTSRHVLLKVSRADMEAWDGPPRGALAQGILDRSSKPVLEPGRKYVVQAAVKGDLVAFVVNKRDRLSEKDRSFRTGSLGWFAYDTSMQMDDLTVIARLDLRWLESAEAAYRKQRAGSDPGSDPDSSPPQDR